MDRATHLAQATENRQIAVLLAANTETTAYLAQAGGLSWNTIVNAVSAADPELDHYGNAHAAPFTKQEYTAVVQRIRAAAGPEALTKREYDTVRDIGLQLVRHCLSHNFNHQELEAAITAVSPLAKWLTDYAASLLPPPPQDPQ